MCRFLMANLPGYAAVNREDLRWCITDQSFEDRNDRNDKFPWEEKFEEDFLYKQPLLAETRSSSLRSQGTWRHSWQDNGWNFVNLPWELFTTMTVAANSWLVTRGIKIVALEELMVTDKTLNDVFDLDYGEAADRDSIGGQWTRSKVENEREME